MPDTPQDLSSLITRAEEIHEDLNRLGRQGDVSELLRAAEETGLNREAVLMALRERLEGKADELKEDDIVFAKSADEKWYPAFVRETKGTTVRVQFATGAETPISMADIKPLTLLPGLSVEAQMSFYGWQKCEIVRFNPHTRSVTINYWGTEDVVPLERVRLPSEKKITFDKALATKAGFAVMWLASGGVLGAIITFLATR